MKGRVQKTGKWRGNSQILTEILDSIGDGVIALDREWNFIYVNHRAASYSGYTTEELIGQKLWDKYPQLLDTDYETYYRQAMTERKTQDFMYNDRLTGKAYAIRIQPSSEGIIATWHEISSHNKAEDALTASEEKYRLLFNHINDGFQILELIRGEDGKVIDTLILDINPAWEKQTGFSRRNLLGKRSTLFFPHPDPIYHEVEAEVETTGKPRRIETYAAGYGKYIESTYFKLAPGRVGVAFRDITNRKKDEEAQAKAKEELETRVRERTADLARSEEKYRILVENANEAVIVFQDNREKFFNYKAMELSGYSAQELATTPISEFIHPDDREMVMERYLKRLQGTDSPPSYEFRMLHKNGSTMWVELKAVLITWENRPAILGLMTDITERKSLDQELKSYAQKITQVQEAERKRIAYELHDDTAQYLSLLKLELDALLQSGSIQDPKVLEKLQFLEKDASRAFDDVRRYSHELRPGVLEHLGLQAALEQIVEDVNKLRGIPIEINVEGTEPEVAEDLKLGFFRIAQEALNNARKHSSATKIVVDLKYLKDQIQMVINDNGTGFNVQKAKVKTQLGTRGSMGLMSMQERAKLIEADLKIESQPGRGTRIIVNAKL